MSVENGGEDVEESCPNTSVRTNPFYKESAKLTRLKDNRLGLSVEPSQIRLNPNATDGYNWKILPEKVEHLSSIFSKKLSDQSVGAYKELFNGVGSNFEAVAAMQTAQYRTGPDSSVSVQ